MNALATSDSAEEPSPAAAACRLPPELVPEHSLADNTWQVLASDKDSFLQQLHAGRIQPANGEPWWLAHTQECTGMHQPTRS